MDTTCLHTTPLAAGQCLHLAVDAGTILVAMQGSLRIDEAPRWLAERMVPVGRTVDEGQAYVVEQAGWLCVTAECEASHASQARLGQVVPQGRVARLVARLLRWRAGLRPAAC